MAISTDTNPLSEVVFLLIARETMDDLWDMTVSKIAAVLRAHEVR